MIVRVEISIKACLCECVRQSGVHSRGLLSVEDCSFDIYNWLHGHAILDADEYNSSVHRAQGIEQILLCTPEMFEYT